MAELYLAKDLKKDRLVVIKRILPYLAQEREFVQMFLDEARIASQLHHPNIITVYELGHLEGSIFIAMEYVEGVDLRKIFNEEQKRGSVVPPNITAWLVSKLCDGLHYAHNRAGPDGKGLQIIHRDVSPQNLMVGYAGQVKLVDFGIAKAGAIMERSKPGVIKGKFLYLSPEQLSQERIDHRADIFALGTMMYEISTGKSPFYKATTEAVIYAIRAEEPPPPHLTRRDFPMTLSKIIMRCLAKDRSKRYQQAGEVHTDLEHWIRTEASTSLDDVKSYVARLFGEEDERTSLFIPANARGPSDRMTDRVAAAASSAGIGRLPPTDPDRTVRGPPASAPTPVSFEETTKPIAQAPPLTEGASAGSIITNNSVITAPIGRRPTPQPMKAVTAPKPAAPPSQRTSNPALQGYGSLAPEPRTQTARPQDLAKAFTTAPPVRKPSGEGLKAAGGGSANDATALWGSGRLMTGDSLPSLTPSAPSSRTPITTENRPAAAPRNAQSSPKLPEGMRATKLPPEPLPSSQAPTQGSPTARKPTRADNGAAVPRAATPSRADNGAVATRPMSRNENGAVARAPTGAVPQARKPTRAESGAVFDVPQQFARDQLGRAQPPVPALAPTLPPEPSTKEERPKRESRGSLDDLGPLLDQALPPAMEKARPAQTYDQDDQENTLDLRGKDLQRLGDSQDVEPSQQLESPPPDDDDQRAPSFAERPLLVAVLVFVVVLVLGLGGLAVYRYRQGRAQAPLPPPPTQLEKPVKTDAESPKNAATTTPPVDPPVPPVLPPSTDVDETQTVVVKFVAPAGTRLIDQRDSSAVSPNTVYRWHPGRHPVQYRCPKKGRLQQPDVTYNVEVKPAVAEQTFTISCK